MGIISLSSRQPSVTLVLKLKTLETVNEIIQFDFDTH